MTYLLGGAPALFTDCSALEIPGREGKRVTVLDYSSDRALSRKQPIRSRITRGRWWSFAAFRCNILTPLCSNSSRDF